MFQTSCSTARFATTRKAARWRWRNRKTRDEYSARCVERIFRWEERVYDGSPNLLSDFKSLQTKCGNRQFLIASWKSYRISLRRTPVLRLYRFVISILFIGCNKLPFGALGRVQRVDRRLRSCQPVGLALDPRTTQVWSLTQPFYICLWPKISLFPASLKCLSCFWVTLRRAISKAELRVHKKLHSVKDDVNCNKKSKSWVSDPTWNF